MIILAIDGRLNFDTKLDTKGFTKGVNSLGNQIENLRNIVIKWVLRLALYLVERST